ncbi:PREDICTED: bifunctional riboflavin kinase/FMN phosphatase-like [Nelumbo nucifera]|uniref:riboflavin kinase n=1 Tax=Nelumbo nucifera TaxID=4432 RepID=A0A1U8B7M8_NELNU|nr:PREDICTED: bifunctional riboflavin kinase/FMN phosphatase-like [Nelumbo nucifera]
MSCCNIESCNGEPQISAVILDLDGTLLNTEKATKGILKDFLGRYGKVLDSEKEDKRLGMTHKESSAAIVKDYDLPLTSDQFSREIMPLYQERWPQAKALPGANRLIMHLHKHGVPFALASNSIRKHIEAKISYHQGWNEAFSVIIGRDEVNSGKPSPDLFLEAAKRMGMEASHCLVIEDSLPGVMAAKAAGMKVVTIPSLQTQVDHYSIANSVLHSLLEFRPELWGLPPFEDWVQSALPIEPMYVKGIVRKGFLCEFEDDGPTALPDQVSGIYFGWAKLGAQGNSKVVVGIGWNHHLSTIMRIIKPCLIDEICEDISDQEMHLLLVGYIRELRDEVNTLADLKLYEEDKSIASAALDLPIFVHHKVTLLSEEASFVGCNSAMA